MPNTADFAAFPIVQPADFLAAFQRGQKAGKDAQTTQEQDQLNQMLAQGAQSGDLSGAENYALKTGNFDYYNTAEKLRSSQIDRKTQLAQLQASAAADLLSVPADQRADRIATVWAPRAKAMGANDATIAGFAQNAANDGFLKSQYAVGIASLPFDKQLEVNKPVTVGLDQRLAKPDGTVLLNASPKLESTTITNADGSTTQIPFNPYSGHYGTGGQGAAPVGTPAPAAPAAAAGSAMSPQQIVARSMGNEGNDRTGGYNPSDANGYPTNWGINWKANADILGRMGFTQSTFKNMTKEQAAQIYEQKYLPQSGALNLPPALQAPYFDVYIRSPARAQAWLQAATGTDGQVDPAKFMQLASSGFQRMAQTNPNEAKYAHAWANRDAANVTAASGGGVGPAPSAQQSAPAGIAYNPDGSISGRPAQPIQIQGQLNHDAVTYNDQKGIPHVLDKGHDTPITPDALAAQFPTWALDPKNSPLNGFGMAAAKEQFINALPSLAQAHGMSINDLPAIRTAYANDQVTLKARQQQKSIMGTSYNAAVTHGNQLIALLGGTPGNSSLRAIDSVANTYANQTNNPSLAQYNGIVHNFIGETARIITAGPTGNGQLTDESQRKLAMLQDPGVSRDNKIRIIGAALRQVQAKEEGNDQEIARIQSRISGGLPAYVQAIRGGSAPAAAPAPAGPHTQVNIPQGAIQMLKANPSLAAHFDEKYGHGASAAILGQR